VRFLPLSIRRQGLEKFLDGTTQKHNGWAYADFVKLYDGKVNPSNLARAFYVDRATMLHWIEVHKEELRAKKDVV